MNHQLVRVLHVVDVLIFRLVGIGQQLRSTEQVFALELLARGFLPDLDERILDEVSLEFVLFLLDEVADLLLSLLSVHLDILGAFLGFLGLGVSFLGLLSKLANDRDVQTEWNIDALGQL